MLDDLTELKTFQRVLAAGSLSAAARELGTTLAAVSKRLAALERRCGLRLVNRTTRALSPTAEGIALLADVERAMQALAQAEERLAGGRSEPVGTLRVTATVSLGRSQVAPTLAQLAAVHPRLAVVLALDDRPGDLVAEGFDVAVRIGRPADSSAVMRKLADNRRILVAAPGYLDRAGRPDTPQAAAAHNFLRHGDASAPLRLVGPRGAVATITPACRLQVDNGDVVHDWGLAGCGLMLKSEIDVAADLRARRLERVLPRWTAGDAPVVALYPSARHLPPRTRVFLDALKLRLSSVEAGR